MHDVILLNLKLYFIYRKLKYYKWWKTGPYWTITKEKKEHHWKIFFNLIAKAQKEGLKFAKKLPFSFECTLESNIQMPVILLWAVTLMLFRVLDDVNAIACISDFPDVHIM